MTNPNLHNETPENYRPDLGHNDGVYGDEYVNRLYDATVIDNDGDKVGGVGQVYLDDATNRPAWVTVHTGFLGMKETFIPLRDAAIEGDTIRVPYDKALIKGAPAIDPDGQLNETESEELYRYYSMHGTTERTGVVGEHDRVTDRDLRTDRDVVDRDRANGEVIAHEERLNVGKEQVETGRVRIRKHVVTENQSVTVPVQKEKLVVEREPLDGRPVTGDVRLGKDEQEVVLHEERPVVSKETVATEKVRLGTETVTENRQVSDQVSKERIEVEGAEEHGVLRGDRNLKDGDRDLDGVRNDRDLKDGKPLGEKIKDATDGNPRT